MNTHDVGYDNLLELWHTVTPNLSVLFFFNEWILKPRVERTNFLTQIASLLTSFIMIIIILMLIILYYIFF